MPSSSQPFEDSREKREESNKQLLRSPAPSGAADATARLQVESSPPARAPEAPLGTGHGRREQAPTRWVDFVRRTNEPAETIAIYYDSYRNLVAQGVLQAPIGRRDPNPFPTSFTPDP